MIKQKKPTAAKYRARWGPDCPGATGDPKRSLTPEAYVRQAKQWTQSNYPGGSQGAHGGGAGTTSYGSQTNHEEY